MASKGVRCPRCNSSYTDTLMTTDPPLRWRGKEVSTNRRRRKCNHCGTIFYSREVAEELLDAEIFRGDPNADAKPRKVTKMVKLSDSQLSMIEEFIDGGIGKTIDEILTETVGCTYDNLNPTSVQKLGNILFACDACNWVFPIEEMVESPGGRIRCRTCEAEE